MNIVADTNVFLAVALEEPERERIIEVTAGHGLIAPEVLPFEIGNALSALSRRDKISAEQASVAWASVQDMPVDLRRVDVEVALAVALRFGIYAYDAYVLECAARAGAPLLTLDKGMRRVAVQMNVELLEV